MSSRETVRTYLGLCHESFSRESQMSADVLLDRTSALICDSLNEAK
jgi:hypothetical protein